MLTIVVLCCLSLATSLVSAYEPIEMNDANRNKLPLEIGLGVKGLQAALSNEFRFERLDEVRQFLHHCRYLNSHIAETKDEEWDNLAGKIKSLLKEPKVVEGCKVNVGAIDKFMPLDLKSISDGWLSSKNMNLVLDLGKKLELDTSLNLLFNHMYRVKKEMMARELLNHAARDTDVFFGEQGSSLFKFGTYLTGCQISRIKPICKLIRRIKYDDVSAEGLDVKDFTKILVAKNEDAIKEHEKLSNVSMDDLKETCQSIQNDLYAIHKINQYKEAGLLDEQQIEQQAANDRRLSFYYELANLCAIQL